MNALLKPNNLPSASHPPIVVDAAVLKMLDSGAPVCFSVSGGKDSTAQVIATMQWLEENNYDNECVLINADLGKIEWNDSHPRCEELAHHYNIPLITTSAKLSMIEIWQHRWNLGIDKYKQLEYLTIRNPWSSSSQRFCTSSAKNDPLGRELKKQFNKKAVLNVVGIRRSESRARAKAPISKGLDSRFPKGSLTWHPIADWSEQDVFTAIDAEGLTRHEAYTKYKNSRVSCGFCVLGCQSDLKNASRINEHQSAYQDLVDIEQQTLCSFQSNKWLMDLNPSMLRQDQHDNIKSTKEKAQYLAHIQSEIPKHLFLVRGVPHYLPTDEEAALIGQVRIKALALYNEEPVMVGVDEVVKHYISLHAQRAPKDRLKTAKLKWKKRIEPKTKVPDNPAPKTLGHFKAKSTSQASLF